MTTEITPPKGLTRAERTERLQTLSQLVLDTDARLHAEIYAAFDDGARPADLDAALHFSKGHICYLRRKWVKERAAQPANE